MADPSSSSGKNKENVDWIIMVENSLKEEPPSRIELNVISRVSECLKNEKTESFYHPQQISFGPYHFKKDDIGTLRGLEYFKTEVAREFNDRLEGGLSSAVEMFKSHEMQKIYDPCIEWIHRDILMWLLVRDACFVIKVLESFPEENQVYSAKTRLENMLDSNNNHPLLNDILKDMFKLENQLPLRVLFLIREKMLPEQNPLESQNPCDWIDSPLKKLSPIKVKGKVEKAEEKIHILQLLGEYMVDNGSPVECSCHHGSLVSRRVGRRVAAVLVLLIFFPVVILWGLWLFISFSREIYNLVEAEEDRGYVSTVEELDSIGVNFKKLEDKGIRHIKFDESNSTLHLPIFIVDDRSEVILRNLVAMETQLQETREKPITRYILLMNDLINTGRDVAILRQRGIIINNLGSDNEAARLWNSFSIPAIGIPNYTPVWNAAREINLYRKNRWRILLAQFKMLHCSKPWLVLSLLGAISLLLLTVAQVACLFRDCQIRK